MATPEIVNIAEAEYWGGETGRKWVQNAAQMDAALGPVLSRLLEHASLSVGDRVLDIGCGAGDSTIRIARLIGPSGHVLGADISPVLLHHAEMRAASHGFETAEFVHADAEVYHFQPGHFTHVLSRFGVMFFTDTVAAFRNIGRALAPGGQMIFASWGPIEQNPWFDVPHRVASARLGDPPQPAPDAPGPMRFADTARITKLMRSAGLSDVRTTEEDLLLRPTGGIEGATATAMRIGAAARVMNAQGATADDAAAIHEGLKRAFARFDTPTGMAVPARINFYFAGPPV